MQLSTRKPRSLRWWIALAFSGIVAASLTYAYLKSRRTERVIETARLQGANWLAQFRGPEWIEWKLLEFPQLRTFFESDITSIHYVEDRQEASAPLDLSYVVDAPELQSLDLHFVPEITDRDLSFVGELEDLRSLAIQGPKITNAGVAHLSRLRQLQALQLERAAVDDEGLGILAGMPRLTVLKLYSCMHVTGAGLEFLPSGCRLEDLRFVDTPIDHGLEFIDVSALRELVANRAPLTDASISPLRHALELEQLSLRETQITDDGLSHLADLKKLEILIISGTSVTRAGAEGLAAQLPLVSIAYGLVHPDSQWAYGTEVESK
jgi:hypothetical protein